MDTPLDSLSPSRKAKGDKGKSHTIFTFGLVFGGVFSISYTMNPHLTWSKLHCFPAVPFLLQLIPSNASNHIYCKLSTSLTSLSSFLEPLQPSLSLSCRRRFRLVKFFPFVKSLLSFLGLPISTFVWKWKIQGERRCPTSLKLEIHLC
ncbi:unnamed protein product [Coffea canephora]|uniref:DH200=94 genomic scaffold, scaffold_1269 n=1 Tax=Coffea canephora TaxID=49390 RepID=A0A068VIS2_COFCA|nr:unnamed protein product [Coffea canephora]